MPRSGALAKDEETAFEYGWLLWKLAITSEKGAPGFDQIPKRSLDDIFEGFLIQMRTNYNRNAEKELTFKRIGHQTDEIVWVWGKPGKYDEKGKGKVFFLEEESEEES